MQIKCVSIENGFYDFDVSGAGTIRRVTIAENIKRGDMFNIYYGDGSYIPHRKEGAVWQGKAVINGDNRKTHIKDLQERVAYSISKSDVFIGESVSSDEFYNKISEKYCECKCRYPGLKDASKSEVLAVDLDWPEYGRSSSRMIVFLTKCHNCSKALTHGTGFGSFYSNGLKNLKKIAENSTRKVIEWDLIITSINQIKKINTNDG